MIGNRLLLSGLLLLDVDPFKICGRDTIDVFDFDALSIFSKNKMFFPLGINPTGFTKD
ncbi:MAG: hypothetical protein ACI9RU_000782 [Litorivivens sp.]|jgi:hypothetical protein